MRSRKIVGSISDRRAEAEIRYIFIKSLPAHPEIARNELRPAE